MMIVCSNEVNDCVFVLGLSEHDASTCQTLAYCGLWCTGTTELQLFLSYIIRKYIVCALISVTLGLIFVSVSRWGLKVVFIGQKLKKKKNLNFISYFVIMLISILI